MTAAARRHLAEAFAISPYLTVRDQPHRAGPGRAAPPARPKPDERPMRPVARRGAVLAALAAILLVAGATGAAAHPLGNFTVNTSSGLRVGPDRLDVDYVVDMAEIPTFQTRQAIDTDHDGTVGPAEAASWRDRECPRLAGGLRATVDGRALALSVTGSALTFPEGVGGLATLRLECALAGRLPAAGRGGSFPDLRRREPPGPGRLARDHRRRRPHHPRGRRRPPTSTSARLTAYPEDQLSSPLDQRTATLRFHPGGPRRPPARGRPATHGAAAASAPPRGARPGHGGVHGAGRRAVAVGRGSRWWRCWLAVGLGAAHALAPGHGKTVMAAYLVGLRGTLRQAAVIGATVTITHTAGVLLLGLVLTTSRAVASERLYPWLGLASGLLLAGVGIGLLVRARAGHHPHPTTTTTPTTHATPP